jgi:hypothetical protein
VVEYPLGTNDGLLIKHWLEEHQPQFDVLMGMSDEQIEEISKQVNLTPNT